MTAGNNGASTPEDDDPFGYLYEDGQAAGAQQPRQGGYGYPAPAAQPGVPRTSYNQVRTVGERQYGQQQRPAAGRTVSPSSQPSASRALRPAARIRSQPGTAAGPRTARPAATAAPDAPGGRAQGPAQRARPGPRPQHARAC